MDHHGTPWPPTVCEGACCQAAGLSSGSVSWGQHPLTDLLFLGCGAVSGLLDLSSVELGREETEAVLWGLLKLPCLLRGKLR